jgi:hypothetical protein
MFELTLAAAMLLAPPPEYDHPPVDDHYLWIMDQSDIDALCGVEPGKLTFGCANTLTNEVFITDQIGGEVFDVVLRHEHAHLNGWRHE